MGGELPPIPVEAIPLQALTIKGIYVGTQKQQAEVIQLARDKKVSNFEWRCFVLTL